MKRLAIVLATLVVACQPPSAPTFVPTPTAETTRLSPTAEPTYASAPMITPTRGALFPFVLPWDDASDSITNVSRWIDKPISANSFVTVKDGHLYVGEKRIRFLGVNLVFGAALPKPSDADKIAARLAKFGINAVRFHHLDTLPAPDGLLRRDRRTLDLDALDKLDYLIAQLKKQGIYSDLNLHVGRVYPGLPTWEEMPQYFKGVDNFHPRMIELQKEYARDLLTHRNPYTNLRYSEDSAIAIVEINNENGLLREWWDNNLDDMPAEYTEELARQWRAWLKQKYVTTDALKQAWNVMDEPLGAEILSNPSFAQALNAWSVQINETAQAATLIAKDAPGGNPALVIQVKQPGKENWHVQFFQQRLRLQKDQPYTLSFWAKSDVPSTIQVNAMQAHVPYQRLWYSTPALKKEWQEYSFTFSPTDGDENARITLTDMGGAIGAYSFAQFSLKPGGVVGLRAGEQLETLPIFRKGQFNSRTVEAQRDWIRFLWETEEHYWLELSRFIKNDLQSRALIIGTQVSYSPASIQAQLDVVDNHAYWQHPRFPMRPWDPVNWTLENISMAGVTEGDTISRLALRRVTGKPYIISEYNHSAPNTFSSEAFLLLSAYAALQDWDGIFAYNYSNTRDDWDTQHIISYFQIDQHATKLATFPAVAALFLRGDVQAPARGIAASFTRENAIERVRRTGAFIGADSFGISRADTLRVPVSFAMSASLSPAPAASTASDVLISDNSQLTWDSRDKKGVVTVNAPRSKAVIGYVNKRMFNLDGVLIAPGATMQDWCAITLTLIEGNDFKSPAQILVTATGYVENTGMGWKNPEKTTVGRDWGKAPTLVEGIAATITLPVPAQRVRVFALDERGQRRGTIPVRDGGGITVIEIRALYGTLWYQVEIR